MKEVIENDLSDDQTDDFLGTVESKSTSPWTSVLQIDGREERFKLDTGAAVSVVGNGHTHGRKLQPCDRILKGAGDYPLKVSGYFISTLKYKGKQIQEKMYVVPGQSQSLLSGSACLKLGLVARLHTLSKVPDFKGEFPELFKGLGKLADPYTIRLRPDVEPKCIYTARRIAHPLLPKVKAEIDRMITEGVISPVEQPTDWCSGIVVVPSLTTQFGSA